MTEEQRDKLTYILGRLIGISFATEGKVQELLLDTCKMLSTVLEEK